MFEIFISQGSKMPSKKFQAIGGLISIDGCLINAGLSMQLVENGGRPPKKSPCGFLLTEASSVKVFFTDAKG
jgi:hypothetical protein